MNGYIPRNIPITKAFFIALSSQLIFLKEQFSAYTIGGALLIIAGVVIMNIKK